MRKNPPWAIGFMRMGNLYYNKVPKHYDLPENKCEIVSPKLLHETHNLFHIYIYFIFHF